jgi:hypothetical protein
VDINGNKVGVSPKTNSRKDRRIWAIFQIGNLNQSRAGEILTGIFTLSHRAEF